MGLSFFNAERVRKERLEKLNNEKFTPIITSDEEPTSPVIDGDEVGEQPKEEIKEQEEQKEVKEQVVKPAKRKRKQ